MTAGSAGPVGRDLSRGPGAAMGDTCADSSLIAEEGDLTAGVSAR